MRQQLRLSLVVAGTLLAGALAAPIVPAGADPAPAVFRDATAGREAQAGRHAIRERMVTVDTDRFSPVGRSGGILTLNLFDDAVVKATTTRVVERGPGDFTWIGEVGGIGYAVVTVQHGVVAGRIVDEAGRAFTVTWTAPGVHTVSEIDPASYRPRAPALAVPDGGGPAALRPATRATTTYVDLLVVYTSRAKVQRGGKEAMEALITNAVVETNQAFLESGIDVELRLVGSRQVDYRETGDSEWDLNLFTWNGDGFMDEVHRWRDRAGADIVSLILDNEDWCGIGWTMEALTPYFERYSFNAVAEDCLDFEATLAHELGHNFGANHEREVVAASGGSLSAVFPYAFGWYLDGTLRTIMAYGDYCTGGHQGCPFVLRFSSSTSTYSGFPTGDADNDNARVIRNTAPIVAAFRQGADGAGAGSGAAFCNGLQATHTAADAVDGVIRGTGNDDVIVGSEHGDVIRGRGGDDTICSLGGNDIVYGNAGRDTIFGGDGRDVLRGGGGRDTLSGEGGNDKLVGNRGNDTGNGGPGTDTCVSIEHATACES